MISSHLTELPRMKWTMINSCNACKKNTKAAASTKMRTTLYLVYMPSLSMSNLAKLISLHKSHDTIKRHILALNHVAKVVPMDHLFHCQLTWEGNWTLQLAHKDVQCQIPLCIYPALQSWLYTERPACNSSLGPPQVSMVMDASDLRWEFQTSKGHQGQGSWDPATYSMHINDKEMMVPLLCFHQVPSVCNTLVCFQMDNYVTV